MAIEGFARELLPYRLNKHSDDTWSLSNRNYKPISFIGAEGEYRFKLKSMNQDKLAKISWNGDVRDDGVFLYNDGTHPMISETLRDEYLARLGELISSSVGS